jgi:tetratricopeptide (TPR) repeat protein
MKGAGVMLICNNCGNIIEGELRYCTECGEAVANQSSTPLQVSANTGGYVPTLPASPAVLPSVPVTIANPSTETGLTDSSQVNRESGNKALLGGVSAVAVVAIALAIYFALASSPENKLAEAMKSAIKAGRMVTLSNDDAYSFYIQLRGLDPTHSAIKEVTPQILPQLNSLGEEIIRKKTSVSAETDTAQDWARAIRIYEWATSLDPNNRSLEARWRFADGEYAKKQQRINEAEQGFSRASQLDPSWAVPYNSLGLLRNESKRYSEAIPYFQRAIDLSPNWEIPYNNMGTSYFYLKDHATAASWYRTAVEKNQNWGRPHCWLGTIYEASGWKCDAAREYQSCLDLAGDNFPALMNRDKIQKSVDRLRCP